MDHNIKKKLMTRKGFLKVTALLLSIYPIKLFFDVLSNSRNSQINKRQQVLSMDLPDGITFHNDIIVHKSGENIQFYSSVCPHLGCRINRLDEKQLVCPCHGSRFSQNGTVLEAPASRNLSKLQYTRDITNQRYIIYLST